MQISQTKVLPNRPRDYLYDSNYTVAGRVDHYRAMAKASDSQISTQPHFTNMFSSLPHYPSTLKFATQHPLPGLGSDRRQIYIPAGVSGQNRYKYFKRPVMPYKPSLGGQIVYAKRPVQLMHGSVPRPLTPFCRTVGIQTIYRYIDLYIVNPILKRIHTPPNIYSKLTRRRQNCWHWPHSRTAWDCLPGWQSLRWLSEQEWRGCGNSRCRQSRTKHPLKKDCWWWRRWSWGTP